MSDEEKAQQQLDNAVEILTAFLKFPPEVMVKAARVVSNNAQQQHHNIMIRKDEPYKALAEAARLSRRIAVADAIRRVFNYRIDGDAP